MGSNATLYEGGRRPPANKIGGPAIGLLPETQAGSLRRNDGSIVEGLGGQPLTAKVDPNVPLNTSGVSQDIIDRMRPAPNLQGADLVEQIQMRIQQRDIKTPAFMKYAGDVFDTQGYPTQTLQQYQDELGEPGGAMIPEQGPLGPGLVGGVSSPRNIDSPNIQPQGIASLTEYFPTQPMNNFQPQMPSAYSNQPQMPSAYSNQPQMPSAYSNQPQMLSGYSNTPSNGIVGLFG